VSTSTRKQRQALARQTAQHIARIKVSAADHPKAAVDLGDVVDRAVRRRKIRAVLEYVGIPVAAVIAMWLVLALVRSCGQG
jgi:hypothetical protein